MSWTREVVRSTLPNGLTVLVERVPSTSIVAVVTHVRAGYFDEPDEWVGIAHVLEHMYFKGTARRGPGDLARETQTFGGYLNAGTIYDKTVYYTVLPSWGEGLQHALDVQSDALRNSTIDASELARELEVIVQEAKRKLDTPAAVTFETLLQQLFETHRIRRWRIGTEENLRRLTRDDVVTYYETRYTPESTIVAVVGDVEVRQAHELIDRYYGNWQRASVSFEGSPPETGTSKSQIRVLYGDVKRPRVALGWRTVEALHEDVPALDMAAGILGSGRGSHLYRYLRQRGIATGTSANHYTPTEVGVFSIGLETEASTLSRAIEEALQRPLALRLGSASEDDVSRVRALMQTKWLGRFESMEGRASTLCEAEALGGLHLVDDLYDKFMNVNRDDVVAVAERYFDPETASVVAFVPEESPVSVSNLWSPYHDVEIGEPLRRPDLNVAPASSAIGVVAEVGPGIFHGAFEDSDLIVREKRGSGLVSLGVHFQGIPTRETPVNAGISSLLGRSALRGAGGLNGEELAQTVEQLGGTVRPMVRADFMGWWLTVPRDNLGGAARVLRAVAEHPTLDERDVEIERQLLASDARRAQDDMFGYPIDSVLGKAFGQHAYGLPSQGVAECVERIRLSEVREWAERMKETKPAVVVVGDVDHATVYDAVQSLTDWATSAHRKDPDPPGASLPARGYEERRKEQSALAMAFPAFRFRSPDRHTLIVTGSLLGGLAGRLFGELREKRSLAYTVAAIPWLGRHAGLMLTYIATSPEREEEAREEMLKELSRLAEEPPDDAELDRARNQAAGALEIRRQFGRSMAEEVLEAWMKGSPLRDVGEQEACLRAVTREDVVRVAQQVFVFDRRAEFVVRGVSNDG